MRFTVLSAAAAALLCAGAPLAAEVVEQGEGHFVTKDEAVVEASVKETWLALIQPGKWWNSAHTWSGDAANLTITPQGGGCFCERIPEVDEPGRFTLEGSVEHMRVIQAYPETALRMVGALGPLQSEPVIGVLTIAIGKTDKGTRIVWEYNVGGQMRYETDEISKAVDGVMTEQLNGLAKLLGRVDAPKPNPAVAPEENPAAESGVDADEDAPASPPKKRETVEEAFGDLKGPG